MRVAQELQPVVRGARAGPQAFSLPPLRHGTSPPPPCAEGLSPQLSQHLWVQPYQAGQK